MAKASPTSPAQLDSLTSEQAKVLLKADQKNLLDKIRKGGVLTGPQYARLASIAADNPAMANMTQAKNQTELAKVMGVDRKSIQRWRKEESFPEPRADGSYNIEQVQGWIATNGKRAGDDSKPMKMDAQVDQILLQNKKLMVQIGILEGEYIHRDDVVRGVQTVVMNAKRVLMAMPDTCAPLVIGTKSIAKAASILKDKVHSALEELAEGEWTATQAFKQGGHR